MNKIEKLLAEARSLLEDAQKAVDEGDLEEAKKLQGDAEVLQEKIKLLKAQEEANKNLDSFESEPEADPKPVVKGDPQRLPFDTSEDNEETAEPEDSFSKSIYVTRYGSMSDAQRAVIKDLYGGDYYTKREQQYNAFVKYLRTGRLNYQEEDLLHQIILTPEMVVKEIKTGAMVNEIKATLQENIGDLGGYLVPEDYRQEIIKRLMGLTIFRSRARVVQTIRDSVEWPKLEGGNAQYTSAVRVTWVDEVPSDASGAETNPTFGMYRIPVHTVMARTDVSRNLMEDAAFNMMDVIADLFAEAMAMDEDNQFATGTGVGRPQGVLGLYSGANAGPVAGIESVNTGNASAITADGLIDLQYGLHAQYRGGAAFVGARLTHRDVRKLKDGNGDYLWARGIAPGEPPTLLGYPFLETESMPAIAANNYPIIFGDLRGYMIVDRVGMSVERVADTTTVGTNKVALFARRRLGGQVIEPWRFQAHKVSA